MKMKSTAMPDHENMKQENSGYRLSNKGILNGKVSINRVVAYVFFTMLSGFISELSAQTLVGTGQTYTSLRTAFNAVNNGSLKGNVVLRITSDITESSSAVLNASGSGTADYTSVTIQPASAGIVVTGNLNSPLIDLNGADNVTIDGRVNGTGAEYELTITNTRNASNPGTSTIRFRNSASFNIIRHCQLKGNSGSATGGGVIYFATSTSGEGNDNNIIYSNRITSASSSRLVNAVYSYGSSSRENSGNIISNNLVYDFFRNNASSNGINISLHSDAFTITGNSFYETGTFAPSSAGEYYIIRITNSNGNNFNISGNWIGGTEQYCGGSKWSKSSTRNNAFYGIYLEAGSSEFSNIQGNIIRNFEWPNSTSAAWTGIFLESGKVNAGTITGNEIGSSTGTGSILYTGNSNNSKLTGIYIASTDAVSIENNVIGSITVNNTDTRYSSNFYGIRKTAGAGMVTIRTNTIGSTSQVNSINATSSSTNNAQLVFGILNEGSGSIIISSNKISNLVNSCTGTSSGSRTRGIYSSAGSNSILNNVVSGISTSSAQSSTLDDAALTGIVLNSNTPGQQINGNTVQYLSSTRHSGTTETYGIHYAGPVSGNNSISGNFVHTFSIASTNTGTAIDGILIETGSTVIANNIAVLGTGVSSGCLIFGISDLCDDDSDNEYYFNTIYIGGTVLSGTTSSTYAINKYNASGSSIYKNNIFVNVRSGGSSGKHYAIRSNSTSMSGWVIDYNLYYVSGNNTMLANFGGTDRSTLAQWRSSTGQDANSLNNNPGFIDAGTTDVHNYKLQSSISGTPGTGISIDFGGSSRKAVPTIGAWEYLLKKWKGSVSSDFGTGANWTDGTVPSTGDDLVFDENPLRICVLDTDRSVRDIINNQSEHNLILNGRSLTITGSISFTNGAYIDATSVLSTVVFAGTDQVIIVPGFLLNNEAHSITAGNMGGVSVEADLKINSTLRINSGTSVTVKAGKKLTVVGTIVNNAGTAGLVLKSDETGTASLMHNTNNVNATVERYVSGSAEAWHFLSSPVSSQPISGEWLPAGTYGNGTGYDLYLWDEASGCWIYNLNTSTIINWNTVHPQQYFIPGRGYLYSVEEVNPVKHFTGILNNGTINIPVTSQGSDPEYQGINLAGNPYPSAIDWQSASGWDRSELTTSGGGYDLWIWNPEAGNYGVINSAGGSGTNGVTRYISAAQGFMVKAETTGNIVINNNARYPGTDSGWLKKGFGDHTASFELTVSSDKGFGYDEIRLTLGSDKESDGAMKIFSRELTAPSLYVQGKESFLSIKHLTDTTEFPRVPVLFRAGIDGTYSLKASFNDIDYSNVILEDREINHFHDLKLNKIYRFRATANDNDSRFVIHFTKRSSQVTGAELHADTYAARGRLVIDLTETAGISKIRVSDFRGATLVARNLPGGTKHEIDLLSGTQLLIVTIDNPAGRFAKRIAWINQ